MSKDKILKLIHPVVLKILSSRRKFDLVVDGKIPTAEQEKIRQELDNMNHSLFSSPKVSPSRQRHLPI